MSLRALLSCHAVTVHFPSPNIDMYSARRRLPNILAADCGKLVDSNKHNALSNLLREIRSSVSLPVLTVTLLWFLTLILGKGNTVPNK